ncbi:ABC transporter permease [Agromyces seonyuensis]|uniref:ABC transporter permease subunit n=1 Tax=Agromyces seonyuensis TaxID=2662446 RepID=A0A6I4NY93_9MICO|nr:ABC transporter permease [Agromyces seonyuensis]MWB98132.1 ABC transporter permease subunit [Agromyces seonyuensis]
MASFILRRLFAAALVLFAATFIMYLLVAYSGDPLKELYESQAPNKEALIEARSDLLNLDVPPILRYFLWLGGVVHGDFGYTVQGLSVNEVLANAAASTIQLVTAAEIIAIVIGLIVGIATALRQYSGFDYSITFLAFLFFSLPVFWVAVLLKQYGAIAFNDWLAEPTISVPVTIGLALLSGFLWMSILGGPPKRRWLTFGVATAATAAILVFFDLTQWFATPSIGIVGVAATAVGAAFLVTAVSTGLRQRRTLYGALITAGIGVALYYPMLTLVFPMMSWPLLIALAILAVVVGGLVGWFIGGNHRAASARTSAITAFLVAGVLALEGYLVWWSAYANASRIGGRPIATVGSQTPSLGGNFWIQGIDTFTHLLLPTIAIVLISIASLSRYARASMLEVLGQDYIRTAKAKGLSGRTVVVRHGLRNALIPVMTIIAMDIGALIGGAVITEQVFGWKGMGQLFVQGVRSVDPNPVMAFFLVTGILAVLFNLIADLLYASLDPRIRVS